MEATVMYTTEATGGVNAPPAKWFEHFFTTIILAESIVVVIVNLVTLIAVTKARLFTKSAANFFIASLTFSDLIAGLSWLGQETVVIALALNDHRSYVVVISWFASILGAPSFIASFITIIFLGVDRVYATKKPMLYKQIMTAKNAFILTVIQWIVLTAVILVPIFYRYVLLPPEVKSQVTPYPTFVFPEGYTIYFVSPMTYVFLVTISVLYAVIYVAFRGTVIKVASEASTPDLKMRKITQSMIIIVVVLVLCWSPIAIIGSIPTPDPILDPKLFLGFQLSLNTAFILLLCPCYVNTFI